MNELWIQTLGFGVARWFHLTAAIIAVGGTFILRYAVLPGLGGLDEASVKQFHGGARQRLWWIVPSAIAVLILSGVINLVRAFTVAPMPPVAYHIILTVKLLGALFLFTGAVGLVFPSAAPNAFQRRRKFWLTMNTHMGLLIVALSVVMRFLSGK